MDRIQDAPHKIAGEAKEKVREVPNNPDLVADGQGPETRRYRFKRKSVRTSPSY
jgi:hypothetical protein